MKGSNSAKANPALVPRSAARAFDFRWVVVLGSIAALFLGAFWYICRFSDKIAFLSAGRGAEWIVYPKPFEATRNSAYPISATFRQSFIIQSPLSNSILKLCAFRSASVFINNRTVPLPRVVDTGWKVPMSLSVFEFLQPGTNELSVTVTNATGPPALWLRLESGNQNVATDRDWKVSLADSVVERACPTTELIHQKPDKSLQGSEQTLDSIAQIWPILAALLIISFALVFFVDQMLQKTRNKILTPRHALNYLLGLILLARLSICFHNIPLLPVSMGFDAEAHEDYIKFISERHGLPLAKDGWEMYQPPLYYAIGALVVGIEGGSAEGEVRTSLLRGVNGVVGLLQSWLVLLCLKRLFAENFEAQAVGLAFAAFLPPNLYLSHYVTNEPLGALCSTAAFYFLLRVVTNHRLHEYIWLGVFLGLAMLVKYSSLIIFACALGAIGLRMNLEKSKTRPIFWRGPLATILCFLAVCSWHYARVWINSGQPLVGNWEATSPFAWRQDPGFHGAGYYFTFGKALVLPLFSSFHSFLDGIYSTLWGDGLASGAARLTFRPPWNYDWMNAGYMLAIGITAIAVTGIFVALVEVSRTRSAQWLFVLGSLGLFALAIFYMSLRIPTYAQVKAFYGLPAAVSLAAVFALGWKQLTHRWPNLRVPMFAILLAWSACVTISFWIHRENPEVSLVRGLYFAERGHDSEALENISIALEKDAEAQQLHQRTLLPGARVEGHFNLGLVLDREGHIAQALEHYREALKLDPDFDGALNNVAWLLATSSQANLRNGPAAITLARRACDLTQERSTVYIGTLAAAYAESGNFSEAISTAEKAIRCARLRGQEALAERNGELLELYRAGKPYREPAGL